MGKKYGYKQIMSFLICIALLTTSASIVLAKAGGYFDSAQTGCGSCHGDTEDMTIIITLTGLPASYTPDQTYPLTLSVSGGTGTSEGAFNLEVSAGTLSTTDPNVDIDSTPNQAAQNTDQFTSWDMDWTAPSAGAGTITVWTVGMTSNADGSKNDGDTWRLASWTSDEEAGGDTTSPTITSTTPVDGATDVATGTDIVITFDEAMNTGTITYTCTPDPGGWGETWSGGNTVLTLSHNNFADSTLYTFDVTGGEDVAGNPLAAGIVPNPFDFTTLIISNPIISNSAPIDGAMDIPITSDVVITFDVEMNTGSITYTCTPDPGGWGEVWSGGNTVLTLSHNDFADSTPYTFEVDGGLDLGGNPLIAGPVPNPFDFTTITIDLTPPGAVTGLTVEHYGTGGAGGDAFPNLAGALDTTIDSLVDIQADDAAGASPSAVVAADGWYTVDKGIVLFMDGFDITGLSGTVTEATLEVQYSVEGGYTGSNAIQWALDGGGLASTGITPANGQLDQIGTYDLFAQGVDTLAEISTLDVEFTSNDGAGPTAVSFDYIKIMVVASGGGGLDDNAVNWTASSDDGAGADDVDYYNIYRSDVQTGPWDLAHMIDTVTATGAASYSYIDLLKGQADATDWWYVVRAVDLSSNEEMNTVSVQEPVAIVPEYLIPVQAGWNFISMKLMPGDTSIPNVLTDLDGDTTWICLQYYDGSNVTDHWKAYDPAIPVISDLSNLDETMGVWILVDVVGDGFIKVEGDEPISTDIELVAGWNMVGFPSQVEGDTAGDLKTDSGGLVTSIERFNDVASYNIEIMPDGDAFQIGQAYWVYCTSAFTWTIP